MRTATILFLIALGVHVASADEALLRRVRDLETKGEARSARQALEQAARASSQSGAVWAAYAQFLDERRDPGARAAYRRAIELNQGVVKSQLQRRLATLSLLANDRDGADAVLGELRSTGVSSLALAAAGGPQGIPMSEVTIPGPMRSFARMAALSPDLPAEDALSALSRNVITNGYQASSGTEALEPTEYLKLVIRYLSQARELDRLSGDAKTIKIDNCDSTQVGELLKVLGFRMRGGCGGEVVLETVNASRAFLTMDSGFPLAELEESLRTNRPFVYDYKPARVKVLYQPEYWLSVREKAGADLVESFLNDPSLCRLYLGMFKLDPETAEALRTGLPVQRIRAFSHVFDFFGGMFKIRGGKAAIPGGARALSGWAELAGASPDQGAVFYEKLVVKDDGWLASWYDSLSRLNGPALEYLTEPARMKRFYTALRGRVTSPGPARPVFRANTDLMLLTTRLRMDPDGRPHIPGGIEVWKNLFINHPHGKYDGKLTKAASGWKDPDDLLEALFGLSRKAVENEPLKIFLALSDLERRRAKPLEAATIDKLARSYRGYGSQYPMLAESPMLSDKTILQFLALAEEVGGQREGLFKADLAGTSQALTGLWQIFVRQRLVPAGEADSLLAGILTSFQGVKTQLAIFDAGEKSVKALLAAAKTAADADPQNRMFDLLAGAGSPEDADSHDLIVNDMRRGFEAQKLVSLKVLFDLGDHLESVTRGEKFNAALANRLAARISDIQLPRTQLTAQERNSFSFGYWTEKHIEQQRKLNLRAVIDKAAGKPEALREARGVLASMLRDTLVGLLYLHYAPPGAQVLYTNPIFVRSHDFIGIQGATQTWRATEVLSAGWPSNAGGRLVGSLANLPYSLAEAEQNFLIPTREQALIWGDLVPQMLVSAKLPRFWDVTPEQMHWVALHMRLGEAWVAESALSPAIRAAMLEQLDRLAPPQRLRRVHDLLSSGRVPEALEEVTPSEYYFLGTQALQQSADTAPALQAKIKAMQSADAKRLNYAAVSEAFGTPKPTLANSHHPELLNLRTFPTLMGYSSRIMAESWESNNLYFAALADELFFQPSQLNYLIPEWTQKTVEQIFATHLEDWPALLRSMRVIGDNVRTQTRKLMGLEQKAAMD